MQAPIRNDRQRQLARIDIHLPRQQRPFGLSAAGQHRRARESRQNAVQQLVFARAAAQYKRRAQRVERVRLRENLAQQMLRRIRIAPPDVAEAIDAPESSAKSSIG